MRFLFSGQIFAGDVLGEKNLYRAFFWLLWGDDTLFKGQRDSLHSLCHGQSCDACGTDCDDISGRKREEATGSCNSGGCDGADSKFQ